MEAIFPATAPPSARSTRPLVSWLLVCCALVFAMVVVGGATRLTHSGLSIVEWQPIVGTIPPLNQEQWEESFAKYRQTPEYLKVNQGMSLAEFKGIFWWEYFHRLLGRLVGVVFLLPLIGFALQGRIKSAWLPKLAGIFVLGALQGAMGWYMVASGLVDNPRVSQYRLTAHLGLAVLIYGAMLWMALDILGTRGAAVRTSRDRGLHRLALTITAVTFVMILSGGFVAGIRAGLAYNSFPLMNGHWIPPEILMIDPWYLNFFNNMATVQFNHRLIAVVLLVLAGWFWLGARRAELPASARAGAWVLLAVLLLQLALGIATLLLVVPVPLAVLHQAGALLVFSAALFATHSLR